MKPKGIPILVLLLVSGIAFFFRLGAVGLFDVDEAVFSEATREMIQSGDWVTPHYNEENRYDKPILIYWLMSASYKVFGVNEWGARIPSAVAGLALLILVYTGAGWALGSGRAGLLSALMLGTSLEIVYLGRAAVADMVLVLFICGSVFSFFRAFQEGGERKRKWYWIGWSASALAVLTKGPVGVFIPALALVPFLLATGRLKREVQAPGFWSGLGLFGLITVPWYGAQLVINGGEFVQAFFIKHHLQRYFGEVSGHRGPVYLFLLVTLIGFYPWSGFLPGAWWRAIPRTRRELKESSRGQQFLFLCAVWFAGGLVFFSFSGTKLPNYMAPMFPAAAALVGSLWEEYFQGWHRGSGWTKFHWGLVSFLCLVFALFFFLMPYGVKLLEVRAGQDPFLREVLINPPRLGLVPFLVGSALLLGGVAGIWFQRRPGVSLTALSASMLALILGIVLFFLPMVDFYVQKPLRILALEAGQQLGKEETLAVLDVNNRPSVVFYSRHPIVRLESVEKARALLRAGRHTLLITKVTRLPELLSGGVGQIQQQKGGYALVTSRPRA